MTAPGGFRTRRGRRPLPITASRMGQLWDALSLATRTGDVSGFAPSGDIHRVRNAGDNTAISLHIYGTDLDHIGTSARRSTTPLTGGTTGVLAAPPPLFASRPVCGRCSLDGF